MVDSLARLLAARIVAPVCGFQTVSSSGILDFQHKGYKHKSSELESINTCSIGFKPWALTSCCAKDWVAVVFDARTCLTKNKQKTLALPVKCVSRAYLATYVSSTDYTIWDTYGHTKVIGLQQHSIKGRLLLSDGRSRPGGHLQIITASQLRAVS